MEFVIEDTKESINGLMRKIGYTPAYFQNEGEFSMVRKIMGGDYPRFHAYIKETNGGFVVKLHLDQKKPSYEGAKGHSGEYDGSVVEEEAERIKDLLSN